MKNNNISEEVEQYHDELRVELAYRISYAFLFIFIALTFAYYFDSIESTLSMTAGLLISLYNIIHLYLKRSYKTVFLLYSITGVIVSCIALVFFHNNNHIVDFVWILASINLAYYGLGRKAALFLLCFSIVFIILFVFTALNENTASLVPKTDYQKFTFLLELLVGIILNFYFFHIFTQINQFSDQKLREANEQLTTQNTQILTQNNEKTILIKEIHHRVKNNLQIIVSLLRLQKAEIENEEMQGYLQESINRAMAMSLIHQKLYQNELLLDLRLTDYLNELITTIIEADNISKKVEYSIQSNIDSISGEAIVPFGLIVNELVTNSLKHAFTETDKPFIEININKNQINNELKITYHDNGTWKEQINTNSFGLLLIETLTEQLSGKMNLSRDSNGTTFSFDFQDIEN
jgi:two-component system, sensor histidine kinase PdtaS